MDLNSVYGLLCQLLTPAAAPGVQELFADVGETSTQKSAGQSKQSSTNAGTASNIRILVAEDNEVNRLVLKHLLCTPSHDVTFAVDGQEAFEAYKREAFDVILMDISMPNMDGYEATRAIRAHEVQNQMNHTPIICVTAHTLEEHREKSIASGMNDYLPKPVGKERLWAKLNAWTGAAFSEMASQR